MLPQLEACWRATRAAADGLDAELPYPLSKALDDAIRALAGKPFGDRIRTARATTLVQDEREQRPGAQD
jgi:hypothetical protein